jgi:hypothetical protein
MRENLEPGEPDDTLRWVAAAKYPTRGASIPLLRTRSMVFSW